MCKENFDYSFKSNPNGMLMPDDLKFFYYDLGIQNLSNLLSNNEEWNEEIQIYLSDNNIVIKEPDIKFENDTIYMQINKKESKDNALFRHLRNAFAHYTVNKEGDYYVMEDRDHKGKVTMRGKIKCEHLKAICYKIIEQNQRIIE